MDGLWSFFKFFISVMSLASLHILHPAHDVALPPTRNTPSLHGNQQQANSYRVWMFLSPDPSSPSSPGRIHVQGRKKKKSHPHIVIVFCTACILNWGHSLFGVKVILQRQRMWQSKPRCVSNNTIERVSHICAGRHQNSLHYVFMQDMTLKPHNIDSNN